MFHDKMANTILDIGASGSDILLFSTLIIVLVLVVLALRQRQSYQRLSESLDADLKKLKEQEGSIKKLENDFREYVMGGKSLREWKVVKQQIEELSELPSFTETPEDYVLRLHLSMTKKDNVRLLGAKNGVKLTVDSDTDPPIQAFYTTPKDIDPNGLKVTYRGNSLEIKAPKAVPDKPAEEKK